MDGRWLSVAEIAVYSGVLYNALYEWTTRRNMPVHNSRQFWECSR